MMDPAGQKPGARGALERLEKRFPLACQDLAIGGARLIMPELADPVAYLEQSVAANPDQTELPYWTKLWPAAMVLAGFAASWAEGGPPVLELGAGLGVPGLVAAQKGRQVVLSDLDPDALEFGRAAVELNELEDLVEVRSLDWNAPPPDLGRFGTVLGAEILYHPPIYPTLVKLLDRVLAPGGTAFISHQERPFAIGFFELAKERFKIRRTTRTMRGEDGDTVVYLYALTHAN